MTRVQTKNGQPAVYNSSAPSLSDGDGSALNVDVNGNLKVVTPSGGGADQVQGNVAAGATDSGNPVKVGGIYNSTPPILTTGQRGDVQLDSSGRVLTNSAPLVSSSDSVTVVPISSTTPTQTSVNGSASSVTILAANVNRKNASVFNDSAAILYLLWGSGTASVTNHTLQIASGQYYELPYLPIFTGQLTGIWSSATGAARVTETT